MNSFSSICTTNSSGCFAEAMTQLASMEPIEKLYLDFDKTITVNDYSLTVRNSLCQKEYPDVKIPSNEACPKFDAHDAMVSFDNSKMNQFYSFY